MRTRNAAFLVLVATLGGLHFHDPEIFHRALLTFDDQRFIAPLRGLSLTRYLTEWLPGQDNYAYPLRDLTYFLDIRLAAWTGIEFFWISNLFYFCVAIYALFRIADRIFRDDAPYGYALVALASLHPMTVEVVQWASIRKHILVAMFLAWGTDRVIALRLARAAPRGRDLGVIVGCYVASLLCWPTGALWIFWAFWELREELASHSARIARLRVAAIAPLVAVVSAVVIQSHDYREKLAGLLDPSTLAHSFLYLLESIGRGAFNLVLPIWIVPYYREHDWRSFVGLGLIAVFAWALSRALRARPKPSQKRSKTKRPEEAEPKEIAAGDLLLLSAALFVPNAFIYFNPGQMLWADRYAYVALPYLLFGLGLLWPRRALLPAVLALAAIFAARSLELVPYWRDDLALMKRCSEAEGSFRCRLLSIEKAFDRGGCPAAYPLVDAYRPAYLAQLSDWMDPAFRIEFPTYDAYCVATMNGTESAAHRAEVEKLEAVYPQTRFSIYFSEVLVRLRSKDVEGAYQRASDTYLLHPELLTGADSKIFNMLRGQARALCTLLGSGEKAVECRQRERAFLDSVAAAETIDHQVQWGFGQSLQPFMTAGRRD